MLELRLQLASARATLRAAKDDHELARAQAEQRAIDANGGNIGKNEGERTRALTIMLTTDDHYMRALHRLRAAEAEVDRLDALLEGARDARRAEEWHIRARLADALLGVPIEPGGDEFDAIGDTLGDRTVVEVLSEHYPDHMSGGSLESTHYAGKRRPQPHYSMLASDEELPF